LFATHYHELTELAHILPRLRNFNVAVVEEGDQVVFLHRLVPGGADRSYGVHVAQLAGMPRTVVNRAREILANLEATGSNFTLQAASPTTAPQSEEAAALVAALRVLRIEEMSPLEAMTKLYELQRLARAHP
jgi:DNA mismatch repair protein MutS